MKKSTKIIIIVVASLIVLLLIFGIILNQVPAVTYQAKEADPQAHWATITGSLGYPSEAIPKMGVCAETKDKAELYCTYEELEGERYTYGLGYELKVPPGKYYVFAHLMTEKNANTGYTKKDDKAYYSNFVHCGLGVECKSHDPILVEAKARETTDLVDPIDWIHPVK